MAEARLEDGFCAHTLFLTFRSRSVIAVGTTNLLVLERAKSQVSWLYDEDGDGLVDSRKQLASVSGLNHGLAIHDDYLYASSDTTVYRWPYVPGDDTVGGDVEEVVVNISADGKGGAPGGHTTRTLALDSTGRLYVSVGSAGNIDADSFRSRIRRCDLNTTSFPVDFNNCEVFADGLRNEVGLAFDKHGILWGTEAGPDNLYREDLGGDIHNDNPAEELHRFPEELAGKHHGYPYCWTEFNIPDYGNGLGTLWAWPSFMDDGYTDDYCRTETLPPELGMQGHSSPLGIVFYDFPEDAPDDCTGRFPQSMDGYAFVAYHGSWNRDIPTGYKVVYIPMNETGRVPEGEEAHDFLWHDGDGARWDSGFRPVDVDFDECGRLVVSSDGTSGAGAAVVRVSYQGTETPSLFPTMFPSVFPSKIPTMTPSSNFPTPVPSAGPTSRLSMSPSSLPSEVPTSSPTTIPTTAPSAGSTSLPSISPSSFPSEMPTTSPSIVATTPPTPLPTTDPTDIATNNTCCTDDSSGAPLISMAPVQIFLAFCLLHGFQKIL